MRRLQRAAELVAILSALGHRSALVGGLAVSARARERFTKDMDFASGYTPSSSRKLRADWQRCDSSIPASTPLTPPSTCYVHRRASSRTEVLPGLALPVACLPHLIAMKTLSVSEVRGQDQSDLRALLSRASPAELQAARVAAALIEQRGFHRNRDLVSDLDRWIVTVRGATPRE
jgi:hypothetical protein